VRAPVGAILSAFPNEKEKGGTTISTVEVRRREGLKVGLGVVAAHKLTFFWEVFFLMVWGRGDGGVCVCVYLTKA